jgi:glutamate N-acetyltransferase/amino-acid N-acetyltransferase
MAVNTPTVSDRPTVERRAVLPAGFRAGGVAAGIKASGRPDVALIVATSGPAAAAAVFTPNAFAAAPVKLSRANLAATSDDPRGGYGFASAVVSTSGCANAATGADGDADQAEVGRLVSTALGVDETRVFHLSTGIIGARLPLDRVAAGIDAVTGQLREDDAGLAAAAEALRTTDSMTKAATSTLTLPAEDGEPVTVTVSGIAKGVGMIHPNMATMLSVVLTDAPVAPEVLWELLRPAAARTWNQLSVDGDTSTNDTVFLLASGAAGGAEIEEGSAAFSAFAAGVEAVARSLARQQAADGEGASTLITCQVSGAPDAAQARAVAREVVRSSLVKAAIHGRDPNWGRIAAAAGNATLQGQPVPVETDRLAIAIAGVPVFDGEPLPFDKAAVSRAMAAPEVLLRLDLGLGDGRGEAFGCDLTEQYVLENSAYST